MKKSLFLTLAVLSISTFSGCSNSEISSLETYQTESEVTAVQTSVEQVSEKTTASQVSPSEASSSEAIGEDQAKAIALEHAGIGESEASFITVKLDYDDGKMVYDIEFYVVNKEYDYEIDAYSGDIISYDYDIESHSISVPAASSASSTQSSVATLSETIGEDQAKAIVLTHAGIEESQASFVTVKLDYDDAKTVYDIEFYVESKEYDYEIEAYSGDILSYDYDIESYSVSVPASQQSAATTSSETIGEDKAKSIALSHAGIEESQSTFVLVKLDHDDGRTVYDIEFYNGSSEYDYEIDAYSGDIISYDYDIESYSGTVTATVHTDKQ